MLIGILERLGVLVLVLMGRVGYGCDLFFLSCLSGPAGINEGVSCVCILYCNCIQVLRIKVDSLN